jgi:hypothetical protein
MAVMSQAMIHASGRLGMWSMWRVSQRALSASRGPGGRLRRTAAQEWWRHQAQQTGPSAGSVAIGMMSAQRVMVVCSAAAMRAAGLWNGMAVSLARRPPLSPRTPSRA